MYALIALGSAASTLLTLVFAADPDLRLLAWVVGPLALLQVSGAALIAAGRRRLGARVVMVGSLPMIPLGLLGAFGARRLLDDEDRARFEDRDPVADRERAA